MILDLEKIETAENWNKKQCVEALYWMVLGDGSLPNWRKYIRHNYTCYFSVGHRPEHVDYIEWKSIILQRFKIGFRIDPNIRIHEGKGNMVILNSKTHPFLNNLADRIYVPQNHKALDTYAISLLDTIGLAIWYQDDGCLTLEQHGSNWLARITATSYSSVELLAIAKSIVDKFGIIFRLNRHAKGFDLALRNKDIDKFFELIHPYIVPSMQYKIGNGNNPRGLKR